MCVCKYIIYRVPTLLEGSNSRVFPGYFQGILALFQGHLGINILVGKGFYWDYARYLVELLVLPFNIIFILFNV